MKRYFIMIGIAIVGILLLAFGLQYLILGGKYEKTVTPAAVDAQILEALQVGRSASDTPGDPTVDDNRYTVGNITYFEDKQWGVAELTPQEKSDQQGIAIIKKQDSRYILALGPGTDFFQDALDHIHAPQSVRDFLKDNNKITNLGN